MLAWLRWRYFEDGFVKALASVTLGGVIIAVGQRRARLSRLARSRATRSRR